MSEQSNEIVRVAIKLEQDGHQFYLDAASNAASDATRKTFQSLAADEVNHIEWIKKIYPDIEPVDINQQLYAKVKDIFAGAPADFRAAIRNSQSDIDALNRAIQLEDKAAAAYEKWAGEADLPDLKELCQKLAAVEKFHRQLLENMINYLEQTDDWFQKDENWMFNGG